MAHIDPDEYRSLAQRCRARAEEARDDASRWSWLQISELWNQIGKTLKARTPGDCSSRVRLELLTIPDHTYCCSTDKAKSAELEVGNDGEV